MNNELVRTLFDELRKMPIVDPHTHVRAEQPVARHLGELLGYHYYTELSNSSRGHPVPLPEDPAARIDYVWPHLKELRGTVQFDWMMGISEIFFEIPRGDWWTQPKERIVERAQAVIESSGYQRKVFERSGVTQAYLTNQFDEDLSGLKDERLVPCLRTDDLVFNLVPSSALVRLEKATGIQAGAGVEKFEAALGKIFERFAGWKMGYAALGLPPSFQFDETAGAEAVEGLLKRAARGEAFSGEAMRTWASFMLDRLSAHCARVKAPFCLMPGADREVYPRGVPAGRDQFRCDGHLRGYDALLNKHPEVRYPLMVVNDAAGLELAAAGWIRHNVYPFSHWWYANNPWDIRRELRRRLDVLPRNKFIGFHSDGYSLEFVLPKFNTYRLQLALVLAERIEEGGIGGSTVLEPLDVPGALALAEQILIANPREILGIRT